MLFGKQTTNPKDLFNREYLKTKSLKNGDVGFPLHSNSTLDKPANLQQQGSHEARTARRPPSGEAWAAA